MKNLVISESGERLDQFLAQGQHCTSRSEAIKWIKDGFVLVNKAKAKPSHKLKEGDQIQITPPKVKPSELTPQKIDFPILFEDKDLLVLDKPAGLVVHPGAGNYELSLVHGLLHHCQDLSGIGGVERPGIVHRLDKGTSGLMVVAKTDKAHVHLSQQFQDKTVQKTYLALAYGSFEQDEMRIENLIKRSEMNRKKFVVNQKKGKIAISQVRCLRRSKLVSLLNVQIHTGRTHQIRVHLTHLGHPVLGDDLYGGTKKLRQFSDDQSQYVKNIGHQLLHAAHLSFEHPCFGELLSFQAEPPEDFKNAYEYFFEEAYSE